MLRAVLSVALAAALLGMALPAVEDAARTRSGRLVEGEARALADAAERLAAGSDPVPPGAPGARTRVRVRLPGRSLASARTALVVGAVPAGSVRDVRDGPVRDAREDPLRDAPDGPAGAASNAAVRDGSPLDGPAGDVLAVRQPGTPARPVRVGVDLRVVAGGTVRPDGRPLVLRRPGTHALALRLVRLDGRPVVLVRPVTAGGVGAGGGNGTVPIADGTTRSGDGTAR